VADDFEGVPRGQWWRMRDRIDALAWALWMVAGITGLLILALIRKGVLAGFGDLFPYETASGG
jgi:hypothetical protein